MKKISTTHVGSLPRSKEVSEALFAIEEGSLQYAKAEDVFAKATVETLAKQKAVGVDIPSDGETSKISYATYIGRRIAGFAGDSPRRAPADLEAYPSFLKKMASQGGTPTYKRPQCVAELGTYNPTDANGDVARMRTAMQFSGYSKGFLNAASPGVIALFQPSTFYKSHEEYLQQLAMRMVEEYKLIVDSGLAVQIDAPDLALGRHTMYKDLSQAEFLKKLRLHIDVLNEAFSKLDTQQIRLHVCWGNYAGPHHCDIEMHAILPQLLRLKVGYILFEAANPRHAHEWEVWKDVDVPEELTLVPGLVDSTSNVIEHPRLIAQRLEKFVNIVGEDNVMAGTDCGFSTFAGFGVVEEEIVWAKLRSLTEGVQLLHSMSNVVKGNE